MMKIINLILVGFILITGCKTNAQPIDSLEQQINTILATKNATVGVSLIGNNGDDTLTIHGDDHFPMQSVFKLHIAIAVLAEVDKGNLSLEDSILISASDIIPNTWSPMAKKYPVGASVSLAEIIQFTIAQSDNIGCDMLLRLLGGPEKVNQYFARHYFSDISIIASEADMHKDWETQFKNWTTPNAASDVLNSFYENDALLSIASWNFLWQTMKATTTGMQRFRGQLPAEAIIAHKTGTSDTNKATGITAAINDIGIVFLPDGSYFILSVFVANSKEDYATNEKIIADITKLCWDYYSVNSK